MKRPLKADVLSGLVLDMLNQLAGQHPQEWLDSFMASPQEYVRELARKQFPARADTLTAGDVCNIIAQISFWTGAYLQSRGDSVWVDAYYRYRPAKEKLTLDVK